MCLTQCSGRLVGPYIIVEVDGILRLCAVRITSIHCRTFAAHFGRNEKHLTSGRKAPRTAPSTARPGDIVQAGFFQHQQVIAQPQARPIDNRTNGFIRLSLVAVHDSKNLLG
jgi:hypothetical protein